MGEAYEYQMNDDYRMSIERESRTIPRMRVLGGLAGIVLGFVLFNHNDVRYGKYEACAGGVVAGIGIATAYRGITERRMIDES